MTSYLLCLLLIVSTAASAQEMLQFDNDSQRELYSELAAELRCPQCQNQNIADSNAIVAVDMRQKTYQLVRDGKNREEILDYMINRYGDFVHYQPPVNKVTIWLWLAPALLLIGLMLAGVMRRRSVVPSATTDNTGLNDELEQLIAKYRSKKP